MYCYMSSGEVANNRELEAQITYFEREMGKAREQQVNAGHLGSIMHGSTTLQSSRRLLCCFTTCHELTSWYSQI